MRLIRSCASILVLLFFATACAEDVKIRDRLFGFVGETEEVPREFKYTDERGGTKSEVTGEIEDGLRYRGTLEIDGAPVMEQVADDDALAVRVIDPTKVPTLASGAAPTSQVVMNALMQGQWVVDPSGAPPIKTGAKAAPSNVGKDPIQDAVEVLKYVRIAIQNASDVRQWREDDITPAYRPSEDNFPPPDDAKGQRRYDLVRPPLPLGGPAGGLAQLPQVQHFRRMAIYVDGSRIVKILEEIDIDGHAQFVEAKEKNQERLLDLLRAVKNAQGPDKIDVRKMSIEYSNLAAPISVRQPAGALAASLEGVISTPEDDNAVPEEAAPPPDGAPPAEPASPDQASPPPAPAPPG